jgi:hypothetical protein
MIQSQRLTPKRDKLGQHLMVLSWLYLLLCIYDLFHSFLSAESNLTIRTIKAHVLAPKRKKRKEKRINLFLFTPVLYSYTALSQC